LPPMMLQTLGYNDIKQGLFMVPGGGWVWVFARAREGRVSVTVADDGAGFNENSAGTGIGLKNVRERLKLAYGDEAAFSIVANFPRGVAATITVPAAGPSGTAHA
jgi:LytS/YehU family sensor histidine kinase